MANWSEGYMSDIDYTYGYYPELSPNNVKKILAYFSFSLCI